VALARATAAKPCGNSYKAPRLARRLTAGARHGAGLLCHVDGSCNCSARVGIPQSGVPCPARYRRTEPPRHGHMQVISLGMEPRRSLRSATAFAAALPYLELISASRSAARSGSTRPRQQRKRSSLDAGNCCDRDWPRRWQGGRPQRLARASPPIPSRLSRDR
jgi:hypothetical protein